MGEEVTANLDPGTPYFPGAYWQTGRPESLAIALEDSGLLCEARGPLPAGCAAGCKAL